ncbi:MAG: hypothetical protein BWY55_00251 [archaeon ADurb.Bin336]|nr:MAG: hypothetical protein BWY55_00251 [archaeon ADurb.Bin336]
MVNCKLCNSKARIAFKHKILKKYNGVFYKCDNCGFLFANNIPWYKEAYENSITNENTGLEKRNRTFSEITPIIIKSEFNNSKNFLDYAGGYGLFSKFMKDKGFKFYWIDRYTQNLYAKDLIWDKKSKIDFLTCFECLEHFKDPKKELKKIFSISKNVLFSTTLLPQSIPTKEWDYYGFNHGQHIAFYEEKTMKKIAEQFKLN